MLFGFIVSMDIQSFYSGAVGGASAGAIIIAVIWTRLHYIEKDIEKITKGHSHCKEHTSLTERVIKVETKIEDDTSN
jgi:hypothetical protein